MSRSKTKKWNKIWSIILSIIFVLIPVGFGLFFGLNKKPNVNNTPAVNQKITPKLDKESKLRVMSWNAYNLGSTSNENSIKVQMIKDVILSSNSDIVGLSEISYMDENIIKLLTKELGNVYSYTFYDKNDNSTFNPYFPNSKESVGIIYNNTKVKPRLVHGQYFGLNNTYTRPLYYNIFDTLDNKYSVLTMFGHFDAPDINKKNNETSVSGFPGQGSQEIQEARSVEKVFKELKDKYPNLDIIMGADTNIKNANNKVFSQQEYKLGYQDYDKNLNTYLTSLSSRPKDNLLPKYANAYDKWFIYDNGVENVLFGNKYLYKIDTLKLFDNKFFDYDKLKQQFAKEKKKELKDIIPYDIIKNMSDHAPILLNIDY